MMLPLAQMTTQQQTDIVSVLLFYAFAGMAGLSALGVVVSRNIVRMAVWLLFTLVGVGGLYFLLAAEFLAAVQLVVYAGGTLILIIFGVMLTSKSPFSRFEPKLVEVVIALSGGSILLFALIVGILRATFKTNALDTSSRYPVDKLGQALLGDFLIPFELASVLLLVVMIGAAYLAKARRRETEPTP
ncbi:MAG: NADH-quinone oxidoreductase subunit J family protein [Tepidisphaeraceae bacterium]